MKTEKVILSFVAILVGLAAAGGAFYLYQMTKTVPQKTDVLSVNSRITPSPTPDNTNLLTVDSPKDEQVFNKRTITISGKTKSDATIVVSTEDGDQVVKPSSNGSFSLTETIPDGSSVIRISSVFSDGSEKNIMRTVTYSTENF